MIKTRKGKEKIAKTNKLYTEPTELINKENKQITLSKLDLCVKKKGVDKKNKYKNYFTLPKIEFSSVRN